jgi:hypothetical protein
MTIKTDRLAEIAQRVANQVRRQIPRSSNRFLDTEADETDWLKDEGKIEYTAFIQTFARISAKGATQNVIQKVEKVPVLKVFTKTVSRDASVRELKDAVLDFLNNGKVDGKPIDLDYKPGIDAEKEYSKKFGAALASHLNALGLRDGNALFMPNNAMKKVRLEILAADRSMKPGGGAGLPLPSKYIRSSAKNAFRFGVGNCEECGCAAFAMLLTFEKDDGSPLAALDDSDRVRVELIHGKSEGDGHFFVLLNRTGTLSVFDDFARWFSDPTVIVCDPWIADEGVGGLITSSSTGMLEVRRFLKPDLKSGPDSLTVRATGYLGAKGDLKDDPGFHLPS